MPESKHQGTRPLTTATRFHLPHAGPQNMLKAHCLTTVGKPTVAHAQQQQHSTGPFRCDLCGS